jgi:hypothetical protein
LFDPATTTKFISHVQGHDYALPDPKFAAAFFRYRPDEIAVG